MTNIKAIFITAASIFVAAGANAHPGHSLFDQGFAHAATSPLHLLTFGGVGIALIVLGQVVKTSRAKVFLRLGGATALLAAGFL